eukprot:5477515-Prymnesium_polylepis.1
MHSCTDASSDSAARLRDLFEGMPSGGEVGEGASGLMVFPMAASAMARARPNTTPLPSTRWSILCLPDSVTVVPSAVQKLRALEAQH